MKYIFSLFLFAGMFTSLIFNNCQDITLIDAAGNMGSFPSSFVLANITLKNLIEDSSLDITTNAVLLPEQISLYEFSMLYAESLGNFNNTSLQTLLNFFKYADQLENPALEEKILKKIYETLNSLKQNNEEFTEARTILSRILGLQSENIKNQIYFILTNKKQKNLDAEQFRKELTNYTVNNDRTYWKNRGINIDKIEKEGKILFSIPYIVKQKSADGKYETDFEFYQYHRQLLYKNVAGFFWKKPTVYLFRGANEPLSKYWNTITNLRSFDWDKVQYFTYNNTARPYSTVLFAFVAPGKIAIAPFFNSLKEHDQSLLDLVGIKYLNKQGIEHNALCSHVAFSYDSKKLTCIINKQPYILDLNNDVIKKIPINADIFSSILIKNNLLLLRTIQGNTYTYNLRIEKLMHYPNIDIDYFLGALKGDDKTIVWGFKQTTNESGQLIIEEIEAEL